MKLLEKLLIIKEELKEDETITDDEYYETIEKLNKMINNNYSSNEIEKARKNISKENK